MSASLRLFDKGLDLSVADRAFERGVVLFVLVGIGNGEGGERLSNASLLPRYPLITAASPERAWESASE